MNSRLEKQLKFIIEVDKIKKIIRKSKHFNQNKYENDAEHSWQICLMALVLSEHANQEIDILKVIKMLLIHDIVEIDAGDVIVYSKNESDVANEELAAERIFGILPENQKIEFINLWKEFEERKSNEAKFATVVDRMEPVMQSIHRDCETWNENNINCEKVLKVNEKISKGSETIWKYLKKEIQRCNAQGLFKTK